MAPPVSITTVTKSQFKLSKYDKRNLGTKTFSAHADDNTADYRLLNRLWDLVVPTGVLSYGAVLFNINDEASSIDYIRT